jgi:hypothetical protein
MGKLILRNNGVETQLINGVDFTTLTPQADTYYIGIDPTNGSFQKFNPSGITVDYDTNTGGSSSFTGGTVTGPTEFTNGLTADTIYSPSFIGDGSQLGGVVGLTYSQIGFTITSPAPSTINQNVVLPYNSTATYPTPLTIAPGFSVTVPSGTTLTIL